MLCLMPSSACSRWSLGHGDQGEQRVSGSPPLYGKRPNVRSDRRTPSSQAHGKWVLPRSWYTVRGSRPLPLQIQFLLFLQFYTSGHPPLVSQHFTFSHNLSFLSLQSQVFSSPAFDPVVCALGKHAQVVSFSII